MELVPYGPEGLDRAFPAGHKKVTPHLVLKQPRGSERYKHLKDTRREAGGAGIPGGSQATQKPQGSGGPMKARQCPSLLGV